MKKLRITYKSLRVAACVYIALPMLLFFAGFCRWYIALPCVLLMAYCAVRVMGTPECAAPTEERALDVTVTGLIVFSLVMLLWTFLGGMNGFWFQTSDWEYRNAVLRDLITHTWPVMYESSDGALVYYIGHWLPPALFGKLILVITGSLNAGWIAGEMALWLWSCAGLTLVVLLLFLRTEADTPGRRAAALLILIFFSGLDIIAATTSERYELLFQPTVLHLEWWSQAYQYSSMTTCLYWVFNQTVVPWIVTLLFLLDDGPENYVFYGIACLLCGPFPAIGLAACMVARTLIRCLRDHSCFRRMFTRQNLLMLVCALPVALFMLSDEAIGAESPLHRAFFSAEYWNGDLLWFLLWDVLLYLALILPDHTRDPMYYILLVLFFVIPYFHVGVAYDFCMRASIPCLFILMIYVMEFLRDNFPFRKTLHKWPWWKTVCAILLVLVLLVGAVTPGMEIYRGFYHAVTGDTEVLTRDNLLTLDKGIESRNFIANQPEKLPFFRYIAR